VWKVVETGFLQPWKVERKLPLFPHLSTGFPTTKAVIALKNSLLATQLGKGGKVFSLGVGPALKNTLDHFRPNAS
jgi:hypothetical protein